MDQPIALEAMRQVWELDVFFEVDANVVRLATIMGHMQPPPFLQVVAAWNATCAQLSASAGVYMDVVCA